MIWIAFVIVALVETLVDLLPQVKSWLPADLHSCPAPATVQCSLEYALKKGVLWIVIALLLFGLEAVLKKIFRPPATDSGAHAGLAGGGVSRAAQRSPDWAAQHLMWPRYPFFSRNLIVILAAPFLLICCVQFVQNHGKQVQGFAIALVAWLIILVLVSLTERETRKTLRAYSSGIENPTTIAPVRFVLTLLFGGVAWINAKLFANKKDSGKQAIAQSLLDDNLIQYTPRFTMFLIGTLVTLATLAPEPGTGMIAIRLGFFVLIAFGFFQSGRYLTLSALLGLFIADQFALALSGADAPIESYGALAIYLAFIILAWALHHWEQAVRYRRALRTEQQKYKQTQTLIAPWGIGS